MTNTACSTTHTDKLEEQLATLADKVTLYTPVFTTPLDIREHRAARTMSTKPILPGVVYPFLLSEYRFPCDVGTYIFWNNYKCADLKLDCQQLGIHNGQDLLELTTSEDAATFIADQVTPRSEAEKRPILWSDADSDDENEYFTSSGGEDEGARLASITISVSQLVKKLKKINHRFSYEFTNDREEFHEDHITDDISSAKA